MGLRKSASPCFTLLLPFISHSSSSTLMHLFICCGLLYSFEDIFFSHSTARLMFFHFALLRCPWPTCVCVCVCVCIYKCLVQAFLAAKDQEKKNPKSCQSFKISMQFKYQKCVIYLSFYLFICIERGEIGEIVSVK